MKKIIFLFTILFLGGQNGFSLNITKSQPKDLESGLTVVTYNIVEEKPYVNLDYSVEWPVSGPEKLTNECRNAIISFFIWDDDYKVSPDLSIEKFLNNDALEKIREAANEYNDWDGYRYSFEINVKLTSDSKKTDINCCGDEGWTGRNSLGLISERVIILNDGRKLDYSTFPPIEEIRPLLLKYLTNRGEPVDGTEYRYLEYPDEMPAISSDYIEFQWPILRWQNLNAKVPMSEFKKFASPALLEIL